MKNVNHYTPISLNGSWELSFYPEEGTLLPSTPEELRGFDCKTIPATVPGNVELDLIRAGLEEDPFYGLNVLNYRKYEFYSWWFERTFEMPEEFSGKDVFINFAGIDTYANVFVNDILVGSSANMLIPHEMELTEAIKPGENKISIHISSAMNQARKVDFPAGMRIWETMGDEFLAIRKPSHSFGWDIACRLLSAGMWRDVTLFAREKTYIKEVYYAMLKVTEKEVNLSVRYRFDTDDTYLEGFSVKVAGRCGDHTFEKEVKSIFLSGKIDFITIKNPKLWWPAGYGDANLYDVTFTLMQHGEVMDTRSERIGFRKVVLERSYTRPDNGEFRFWVNDKPIMVLGTNWVPLDCLHSRDIERLPKAHEMLRDIGCNMVRMWGGNVYESDEFFDLCDEHGIMVWQDFGLACGLYNQYDDFCKVIEDEANGIIKRLRNHASIVLWAGDNEIDICFIHMGQTLPHARQNRLTREILPRAVAMNDPFRDYLPSSPLIEAGEDYKGDFDYSMPEQHNWGPRDYYKSDFHRLCKAHFISETGYHGSPSVSSYKKFIPEEELWPYSPESKAWTLHNSDYLPVDRRPLNRNDLMFNQVKVMFGKVPEEMEKAVLASQITQAEAVKFLIEKTRIQKWRRSGILWWNLIDGWPQTSDSVVDYYYQKKIAYHYIKRSQQSVLIIIDEPQEWKYRVMLCNDSPKFLDVTYRITDFDEKQVVQEGVVKATPFDNIELPELPNIPGEQKLFLIEWEIDGKKYGSHYASGFAPMNFEKYQVWLEEIAKLPHVFNPEDCYL